MTSGSARMFFNSLVIFIPYTPKSQLRANLNRLEGKLGFKMRFKVMEEVGQLSAVLW